MERKDNAQPKAQAQRPQALTRRYAGAIIIIFTYSVPCCAIIFLRTYFIFTYPAVRLFSLTVCALILFSLNHLSYPAVRLIFCAPILLYTYPAVPSFFFALITCCALILFSLTLLSGHFIFTYGWTVRGRRDQIIQIQIQIQIQ